MVQRRPDWLALRPFVLDVTVLLGHGGHQRQVARLALVLGIRASHGKGKPPDGRGED
jgi:hypothetical protein